MKPSEVKPGMVFRPRGGAHSPELAAWRYIVRQVNGSDLVYTARRPGHIDEDLPCSAKEFVRRAVWLPEERAKARRRDADTEGT